MSGETLQFNHQLSMLACTTAQCRPEFMYYYKRAHFLDVQQGDQKLSTQMFGSWDETINAYTQAALFCCWYEIYCFPLTAVSIQHLRGEQRIIKRQLQTSKPCPRTIEKTNVKAQFAGSIFAIKTPSHPSSNLSCEIKFVLWLNFLHVFSFA